jgi:hypothetical protein
MSQSSNVFGKSRAPKCKESMPKQTIESFSLRSSRNSCHFVREPHLAERHLDLNRARSLRNQENELPAYRSSPRCQVLTSMLVRLSTAPFAFNLVHSPLP